MIHSRENYCFRNQRLKEKFRKGEEYPETWPPRPLACKAVGPGATICPSGKRWGEIMAATASSQGQTGVEATVQACFATASSCAAFWGPSQPINHMFSLSSLFVTEES